MKRLFVGLFLLILAVGIALLVRRDPGYVLLSYGDWTLETSLALGVVLLCMIFAALYVVVRLGAGLRRLPMRLFGWRRRRAAEQARVGLERGLIELAEGHWERAERDLARHAQASTAPLLHYLAAARAAHMQGAEQRREAHLAAARHASPHATLAIGITEIELALTRGAYAEALSIAAPLRVTAPRHGYILKLMAQLLRTQAQWDELLELIPELMQRGVMNAAEIEALELEAHRHRLVAKAARRDLSLLQLTWNRLPYRLRRHEVLLVAYARALILLQANATAEPLLREALRQQWSQELLALYGQVIGNDPGRQLAAAESWLKGREHDATLLLALGRICKRNRLWGKARTYLEASLGQQPSPQAYLELATLLEQLKDSEGALEQYRAGLRLTVSTLANSNEPTPGTSSLPALPARRAAVPLALPQI